MKLTLLGRVARRAMTGRGEVADVPRHKVIILGSKDFAISKSFLLHLEEFASNITKAFNLKFDFNPEDQLKKPVSELLEITGGILHLNIGVEKRVVPYR